MLWLKDLRALIGLPGRLTCAEGFAGSRMTHLPCTVRQVDHREIVLAMPDGVSLPRANSAVVLEVAARLALIQCFTTVRMRGQDHTIHLHTPARPHVVQRRRYPRVDLFLSVHIFAPERSITPLPAQLINLSQDGAACVIGEPLEPGMPVRIDLSGIGLFPAEARAEVRRSTPNPAHLWVIGLQFTALLPEQQLYLEKYLAAYLKPDQE
jgi:hypothetical protein